MHPFAICVVTVIIVFTVGDESGADEIVGGADGADACKSGLHDDTGDRYYRCYSCSTTKFSSIMYLNLVPLASGREIKDGFPIFRLYYYFLKKACMRTNTAQSHYHS